MPDLTSIHVAKAIRGESDSREWIVEHFTPALLLQAEYRLQGPLRSYCEPEDLVQEVWSVALPRLPDLETRDGRWTPVLVRFLGTTLLHKIHKIARAYARGQRPRREASMDAATDAGDDAAAFPDDATSVLARVARREATDHVNRAIEALDGLDREILVLRGIEQLPNRRIAEKLGENESTVSMRYRRALDRLRRALPTSLFAELEEGPPPA